LAIVIRFAELGDVATMSPIANWMNGAWVDW
jgi:hypothetical protein